MPGPDLSDINGSGYHLDDSVSATPDLRAGRLPDGLNGSGMRLLTEIAGREQVTLRELVDLLETTYGCPREVAERDIASFVQRAQLTGLVSYRQRRGGVRAGVRLLLNILLLPVRGGVLLPSIQRTHHPFSVGRMLAATASAQLRLGLVVLVLAVIPLSFIAGFWSVAGVGFLGGLTLGVVGGLVVLGLLHESAHALMCHVYGAPAHSVYRQGLRVGLQRRRLGAPRDLVVAAIGPVTGTAAGCALVALAMAVDSSSPTSLTRAAILGVCLATALQVACLVPPAADGRVILACLRGLRPRDAS